MIPLTHPVLHDYFTAASKATDDDFTVLARMFVDRMQEIESSVSLADYCWWLAKCRDEEAAPVQTALAEMDEALGNRERAEKIRRAGVAEYRSRSVRHQTHYQEHFDPAYGLAPVDLSYTGSEFHLDGGIVLRATAHNPIDWRREGDWSVFRQKRSPQDMRRIVLELYPEIKYRLDFSLDDREIALARDEDYVWLRVRHHFASHGFRVDLPIERIENPTFRRVEYTQTLTAPQLIPPEHGPINAQWGTTNSTPLADFRRVMDRIRQENALPLVKTPQTFILPKID